MVKKSRKKSTEKEIIKTSFKNCTVLFHTVPYYCNVPNCEFSSSSWASSSINNEMSSFPDFFVTITLQGIIKQITI
jgi:hypothetical protein